MLSILNDIEHARGNDKLRVLKGYSEYPNFKEVLLLAYNPFLKFGIQEKTFPVPETCNPESQVGWIEILGILKLKPSIAELEVLLRRCTVEDQEVIRRIVLKDLRCGINVTSINKVFRNLIPVFKVMLAQKINWSRVVYPCYSEPKLDGVRCLVTNDAILTRSGRAIVGCDHILKAIVRNIPQGMAIDGELMVRGLEFDSASGNIRSHQDSPDAYLEMFDVAYLDKSLEQKPFAVRKAYLMGLKMDSKDEGHDCLSLVKPREVYSEREARAHATEIIESGGEGTILKPFNYKYVTSRSYSWMKIKNEVTFDLECIGFYEGKGNFAGTLGGIRVLKDGVEIHVGGGFTDAQRDEIWTNQSNYVGIRAEVYGQQVTEAGSLRHPQFRRWRFDL